MRSDAAAIAAAARCLRAGGLVAFATETVYGLGADAANAEAVARLYAVKDRPRFNPLITHVADPAQAHLFAAFDAAAEALAEAFWPGPLTLVLPKRDGCPVAELATTGLETIAVRVPAHRSAQALLAEFGGALVAPSANRSGHVSPTSAAHVLADLRGKIDMVIDDGPCPIGVESTIVACLGTPTLLRTGGLTRAAIESRLGGKLADIRAAAKSPMAPGMLPSHYAPRARLRLAADAARTGEALLAFGGAPATGRPMLNLSVRGDLVEAAANLFSHLRALDAAGTQTIAVMSIPQEGLGEAINDRLQRAAAPRGQRTP